MVILCPLVLGMLSLFFWQQGLALSNTTTIEFHIKRYAQAQARKEDKKYQWPYDFGPPKNLILFFGEKSSHWLCPVLPDNLGDGINFPVAFGERIDDFLLCFFSLTLITLEPEPLSYSSDEETETSDSYQPEDEILDV